MRPYRGKISRRVFSLLLILAAALSLAPATMARQPAGQSARPTDPRDKIHADLLGDIDAALSGGARLNAADRGLQFVARIVPGTNLAPYAERWFARPFVDPMGLTVAAGSAKPSQLLKLAALQGVLFLQRPESLVEPPEPVDPDVDKHLNSSIKPKINTDPNAPRPGPAPNGWYHTTPAIHGSTAAWDKGYTGDGVRLMSNDSGADYCHPDLQGTWAYIDDSSSPYDGLPQMFDSYTSFVAAFDYYTGSSFIADGLAYYADTSTEINAPPASNWDIAPANQKVANFQPLGASAAHTYTLPGTSISGSYHIGFHPDNSLAFSADLLSAAFGDGTAVSGERAAVLVVDGGTSGRYDHVYVDLNYNYDFTDDEPAILDRSFQHHEAACLDYDEDGLNDVSGGLVYFVSDGTNPVPTLDWYWGIPGSHYGNGDLVAFHVMDFFASPAGNHGMGTTSVAVGQGRVRGSILFGPEGPPQAEGAGLVVGPGKDVMTTQNGDFYSSPFVEDGFIFAALGYDGEPGTDDDIQIISNSWGSSDVDHDGWDAESRLLDLINRTLGPNLAMLIATGNGAAAYGTITSPKPSTGIGVGASTLYDTFGGFEPIESADQIVGGDPMSWSNRGPGADNSVGVDVVATGAFGTGDLALNEILEGAIATDSFGGTSMATPVAAGNLALIYDAWRARTGRWPTFEEAKAVLMGTAKNTHHDTLTQGAGLVDADEGTDVASGRGGTYSWPTEWRVGSYRGNEYASFANIIGPGGSDTQTFTLPNYSNRSLRVRLGALRFRSAGTRSYSFTSNDQAEDHGLNAIPDYVLRIDQDIPQGTELLQVHVSKPYEQFDPNGDLSEPFNNWRVYIQNWTDLDNDGQYWVDADNDGHVDVTFDDQGAVSGSEMDVGEFIRFTYGYNTGPTQQARVGKPLDRMDDGILLTFRHRNQVEEVPQTDLTVEASFWKEVPWGWITFSQNQLTIPARGQARFNATVKVPRNTPYGIYEGSIVASYGSNDVQIPVTIAVAATGTRMSFGGTARRPELYDNSQVFGYTDYDWRADSGDWRFFWTDIREADLPSAGTSYLVADNTWGQAGTDIDTILLGPTEDCFSNGVNCPDIFDGFPGDPDVYGPYTLEPVGSSVNTHIGNGRWRFQTSSGGSREMVAAPARPGLHGILLHQVRVGGGTTGDPFSGRLGLVSLDRDTLGGDSGTVSTTLTINSQLAFENFQAEGFGLSRPITTTETARQDDPNDPSTASFTRTVTIQHGALLEVQTSNSVNGSDLDLYLYGPDGELLNASTSPEADEFISLLFPEDGTYTIAVHGFAVASGTDTFDLMVNAVQGNDITVSNLPASIPAGGSATITVSWDTSGLAPGTYHGLVLMGPAAAPGLLQLPVEVNVE